MNRLVRALALCLALAGCTGAAPATQPQTSSAPPTQPAAEATATDPVAPTSTATEPAVPTGLIAYELEARIWVVEADGTDARELLPELPGNQYPIAWSRDGSRLLYSTSAGLALTDAGGSEPMEFELPCPPGAVSDPVISSCRVDIGGIALSPDGARLAYPIWEGSHDQENREVASTLVVMDVATGHATRLESTRATTPSLACGSAANQGENHSPSWSPDGTRLVFARDINRSTTSDDCPHAVMTVDADGSDMRQILAPGSLEGLEVRPTWSLDGASILIGAIFNSGSGAKEGWGGAIYAVRPDGTGLTALTSDGASVWPTWTRDERIAFVRWLSPADSGGDPWVMDADGGNATMLEATIPSLTAAGCLVCAYPMQFDGGPVIDPLDVRQTPPLRKYETATMLWQPGQGAQP